MFPRMESEVLEAAAYGRDGDKAANFSKASNRKLGVPVRSQQRTAPPLNSDAEQSHMTKLGHGLIPGVADKVAT